MKTLKLTLVATIVAFALGSLARADGITEKPRFTVLKIMTLEQAKTNPGLVNAMYSQLDLDKLVPIVGKIFYGEVKYHGQVIRIRGGYGEWMGFFRHPVNPPMRSKPEMRGIE